MQNNRKSFGERVKMMKDIMKRHYIQIHIITQ